uniref:Uncharacterized protein n=1 Tax=Vespula pensylvanica TaxID=30213 RepID=A0A834UGX8_VESPE|nr:hypothetical protein H0235_001130 [Vespula pensylvanica]
MSSQNLNNQSKFLIPSVPFVFRAFLLQAEVPKRSEEISVDATHPALPLRAKIPLCSRSFGPAQHQVNALVTNAPCSSGSSVHKPYV